MKSPGFKDNVRIRISSGRGGNGIVAFRRERFIPRGGPAGGDGGRGGHVYFAGDNQLDSLLPLFYRQEQRAGNGEHGRGKDQYGRAGDDLVINVPCGTVIRDVESGETLAEILHAGQKVMAARGGRGGRGNRHFATSVNRAPRKAEPGEEGRQRVLDLELKLVAEIGLVGYPNAGKSTLLSCISNARPRIAAYPFTTLQPTIGIIRTDDFQDIRVADLPGLIDGAHRGVGLGHRFLRHIERTSRLLFVVDMGASEGRDPAEDYFHLREEIRQFKEDLDRRPYKVVASKMDLEAAAGNLRDFRRHTGEDPVPFSRDCSRSRQRLIDILQHDLRER